MKNILIVTMTIMLFSNCKNSNTQNNQAKPVSDTLFYFSVSYSFSETSKDSHRYTQNFILKKGILYYDYIYGGFPAMEEDHQQKQLNDSIIDGIKAKLKELSLYQNYKKDYPGRKDVFKTESDHSLTIETGTSKYSMSVSRTGPSDEKNDDEVENKISEFYYFILQIFPQKQ
jgi:hypothetical protein